MAKSVIYQTPADQVADAATITVQTGTAASGYPASYLADGNLARPAKLVEQTGAFRFAFPAAQRVDLIALGPHNLDVGLSVKIQGNAADSWGSPTLDQAITIPAADADGRRVCAWLDLTDKTGYSTNGFQYWRLQIAGTNTQPVAIGEVWLGALKRTLSRNYRWQWSVGQRRRLISHETEYGVETVYDLLVRRRSFTGRIPATASDGAALLDWHRAAGGRVSPVLFVPDASVNEAWWARLQAEMAAEYVFPDLVEVELHLEELSHGLPL